MEFVAWYVFMNHVLPLKDFIVMLITSVKIIKLMLFEGYFLKIIVKTCMINVDNIG